MKRLDLGQTISIFANLGVIAGIIFLAIEVRQNNELMAADARFNRLSVAQGSATLIAENPDLAGFFVRIENGESLAPEEQLRVDSFVRRGLLNMEWTFNELSDYPIERWKVIMRDPSFRKVWADTKGQYSDEFVTFIEANITDQQ